MIPEQLDSDAVAFLCENVFMTPTHMVQTDRFLTGEGAGLSNSGNGCSGECSGFCPVVSYHAQANNNEELALF